MPPRTNPLQRLAPDQRAAVELVLRQGRSYGELACLLGLPEETIRARARGGLEALAPDLPPPPRAGEVADWLLSLAAEDRPDRPRDVVNGGPPTSPARAPSSPATRPRAAGQRPSPSLCASSAATPSRPSRPPRTSHPAA